jgi:hypothetical protein
MTSYDDHLDSLNAAPVECQECGDHHSPQRCPWAETCAECDRDDATMAEPRLCVDCADELERAAARAARLSRTDADYYASGENWRGE